MPGKRWPRRETPRLATRKLRVYKGILWQLRLAKGLSSNEVWHWCTRTSGLGGGFSRDFVFWVGFYFF